jgi:hypothetical protein
MKKLLLSISCIILLSLSLAAQDTLVTYKFKIVGDSSQTFGNTYNIGNVVVRDSTFHGHYAYSTGAEGTGDYCLSSTGWTLGLDSLKNYHTTFATTAYQDILFSSRQKSSNTGPKDFKVQYMVGSGGIWTDVPGATVTDSNDNFIKGTLTNIALPPACDNQSEVSLRWVMTSNTSVNLGTVSTNGTSRIDNIFVLGTGIGVGINSNDLNGNISIYPNPSNGNFTISNPSENNVSIDVLNILGSSVLKSQSSEKNIHINMEKAIKGIYFVQILNNQGNKTVKKLIIK